MSLILLWGYGTISFSSYEIKLSISVSEKGTKLGYKEIAEFFQGNTQKQWLYCIFHVSLWYVFSTDTKNLSLRGIFDPVTCQDLSHHSEGKKAYRQAFFTQYSFPYEMSLFNGHVKCLGDCRGHMPQSMYHPISFTVGLQEIRNPTKTKK